MSKVFLPLNFCDGTYQSPEGERRPADGLAVRLTSFCDNACSFCIAAEGMKTHLKKDIPKVIESTLASGATSLLILGGEPLLFLDDCLQFLQGVREKMKFISLTTALPITVARDYEKFKRVAELLDALTISLQSTQEEENNLILRAKKPHERLPLIGRIAQDFPEKLTVVLNLSQGGLDSRLKVLNALDDLSELAVPSVRLNELQKAKHAYVRFEDLFPEWSGDLGSPFSHGCRQVIEDFYPGMRVTLKRSCFLVEESLGATDEDLEKVEYRREHPEEFAWQESNVLMEDGRLQHFWDEFRE